MAIADPDLDDLGYEEDEEKRKAAIPPPPPVAAPGAHQPSRFDSGSPVAPPIQPYAINQPGDVTPGIGLARGEIASRPPDLGPAVTPPAIQPRAPGFAERYAALQPPQRNDPRFAVPGWKKGLGAALSGIAAGFSPNHPSAEGIYDRIANGPYERAEEEYEQQAGKITNEAKLADEEQRMKQLDMVPVKVPWQEEPVYVQRKDAAQLQKQVGANAGKEATTAATQEGANKRTEEGNQSREKIASQNVQSREKLANQTLAEKADEFRKTDEYRKWKAQLDDDTKVRIANLSGNKAPAAVIQTAEFATSGLNRLADAQDAMRQLQASGVMGSLPANKVEDWIFGKGLVDPGLDSQTRFQIGRLRAALGYTSSAAMRAHTGRTSREIYEDFSKRLGAGQDWSALQGAIDETENMLGEYANAASNDSMRKIREGTNAPNAPSGGQHQEGDTRTNRKTGEVQTWEIDKKTGKAGWRTTTPPKQQ